MITQKCQYALRALFELARRDREQPAPISAIAEAQAIPPRFLEVILNQLKQGGFVTSRRGSSGGYMLARRPEELTVGEVIRFVQGPVGPVGCVGEDHTECPLRGQCVFLPVWNRVREAIDEVYDGTTFEELVENARRAEEQYVPTYTI